MYKHIQNSMTANKSCRLCMSTNSTDLFLDIFSGIGIEMKISEIISEHFKCEVIEYDSLPNFVCQICWQTTETFHELYEQSKMVQEKFQSSLIKIESDTSEVWQSHKETHFIEETQVELGSIKIEPNSDEELDTIDNHEMDYAGNSEDSDGKCDEMKLNGIGKDDADFKCRKGSLEPTKKRQRTTTKNITMKFAKLFKENKHLFDMTCDSCPTIFKTLDEARKHYATMHKNSKGYIKCCSIRLTYPCKVINHLQKHLERKQFKCTECAKECWTQHQLDKHMKQHTQLEKSNRREKTVPCNVCEKMFATEQSLQHHMKRHNERHETEDRDHVKFIQENFDLKCDFCDTVFGGFHDARRHYKEFHNDDKGYIKCCNIKLRELWIVRDHVKSHLNPECFKCDICNKSFSSGMVLVQHKRRHRLTMHKSFTCDFCGKSCRDKNSITRHIFTKHVNSEPKFECVVCHKKFQLEILLKNHTYAVHREKKHSVTCEICGKSFYVKFHLDKHMLSHTDKSERLMQRKQCEYCGEWLMTKGGIYYHEQIHTSGIQKCPHCPMELANKMALLGHIRQYHREHKFKCSYCDKTFATASMMKTHEESHTRHNVYQCRYCPRTFSVPSSRRTHTRRNHQDQIKRTKKKNE